MKIQVRFHSNALEPSPQNQRSLARRARHLAEYLSRRFHEEGLDVVHVDPGEYGCLSISLDAPFSLCVGCYHADENRGKWVCTIEGAPEFFRNLIRPVDPRPDVCHLQKVLHQILSELPEVEDVEWSLDIDKCYLSS